MTTWMCATGTFGGDGWTVVGTDRMDIVVLEGEAVRFRLENVLRGPGWRSYGTRMTGLPTVEKGNVRVFEQQKVELGSHWSNVIMDRRFDLRYELRKTGPQALTMSYRCRPELGARFGAPAPVGERSFTIGPVLANPPYFRNGTCAFTTVDGRTTEHPMPGPQRHGFDDITCVVLKTADGEVTRLRFDPPLFVHCDAGQIRCFSGNNRIVKAGETFTQQITLELPGAVDFEPENRWVDTDDWIVYENKNDFAPGSVIGMEDWLDGPAGKHGWMRVDGDGLVFEDGTPVKLYGIGIGWHRFVVDPQDAEMWSKKCAKYGINVIRLIPFVGDGYHGIMTAEDHSVPMPEKMEKLDFLHAALKKRGVYVGWSPQYHTILTPADRDRILGYDEIQKATPDMDVTYTILNIGPDIQDLLIEQTLVLLDHRNPHTGLRYADDPAIAWIELRNENEIFFNFDNFARIERDFPGYFRRFQRRFCKYLKDKYKTQEALQNAWGEYYPEDSSLAARDIRPHYPHWETRDRANPYVADTMHFMYLEQKAFYERYAKAIRDAGYQGALNGSCWQASCWLGHLYNTLSDAEVGIIDRHNYNFTRLNDPGTGNMTVGFQQVRGRPFNFSEWGGGPLAVPTVGVYGLGLQGWDISNQFSSAQPFTVNKRARAVDPRWTDDLCCDDFIQIGQFPAVARMVYRRDVEEGDIVASRRVSIPGLFAGNVGFEETFTLLGGANNKSFSSSVPNAALAAGRVVLEYINGPVPDGPVITDVQRYLDEENEIIRSNTGQLLWDHSGRGFFTVNTPGTQAVIGYAGGRTINLDEVTIRDATDTELKLYVSALGEDATIGDADRLLITAFGRDANTGMVFDEFQAHNESLVEGREPLLLEPVRATITIKGRDVKSVRPLDHGGRLRCDARTLEVDNGTFTIDGKDSQTVYYLVEMR